MQNKNKLLEDLFSCPICYNVMTDPITTICGHNFCLNCITMNNYECAFCRKKLDKFQITPNYQIKENIEKIKQFTEEKQSKPFQSPGLYRKENYYNTPINGNPNRYRVKRKFEQINFSPPRVRSEISYSKIGLINHSQKSQFINNILSDFRELEDYDIFSNRKNTGKMFDGITGPLRYEIDVNMQETGMFSRRFKYA
jgi:hypothetical protein